MKSCSRCRAFKPPTAFDHSRSAADNRHHRCKTCERQRDKERQREGAMQASIDRWRERHPEGIAAHEAVHQAVKAGILKRGSCSACGSTKTTHGHHTDYSRPLDVTWLCRRCHVEHHRLERFYGRGQILFTFMECVQ